MASYDCTKSTVSLHKVYSDFAAQSHCGDFAVFKRVH